jgi:hypothetical protein
LREVQILARARESAVFHGRMEDAELVEIHRVARLVRSDESILPILDGGVKRWLSRSDDTTK